MANGADEFDMDECDLFDTGPASPHGSLTGGAKVGGEQDFDFEEEDAIDRDGPSSPAARYPPGLESESAKSSTLGVTLEDCCIAANNELSFARSPHCVVPRRKASRHTVTSAPCKMGSSVPVNIPGIMARVQSLDDEDGAGDMPGFDHYPGTFIPPHQLSQRNAGMFSLHGESPAAAFKRERLKARDVILKSTGFLEGKNITAVAINSSALPKASRGGNGGLSQALLNSGSYNPSLLV